MIEHTKFVFWEVKIDWHLKIDGVAMRSFLAPVLANLFMGHNEREWLGNYDREIIFYRRYVDYITQRLMLTVFIISSVFDTLILVLQWKKKLTAS